MLYEILKTIRNFFPDVEKQRSGVFTIRNNVIEPFVSLYDGQYFLIEGSHLNDGVHLASDELKNEEFRGTITPLNIPADFLSLVAEIEDFQKDNKPSLLQSESFGGYSYSRGQTKSGNVTGWQNAFATRLNAWRKL